MDRPDPSPAAGHAAQPEPLTRRDAAVLAATTCVALVLCLIRSGAGLTLEEIDTIASARGSLGLLLTRVSPIDHPLYRLVAKLSTALLGESPLGARLPAILLGVGSVPALWWVAREVSSRRVARLGALLMALSLPLVWYAQTARGYSALVFFSLLCTGFLLRGMRGAGPGALLGFAVCAAALLYTHGSGIFFVAALGLASVRGGTRPGVGLAFAGALLLALALYAPALPSLLSASGGGATSPLAETWAAAASPAYELRRIVADLAKGQRLAWLAAPLALIVVAAGLLRVYRRGQRVLPVAVLIHGPLAAAGLALASTPLAPWILLPSLGFLYLFAVEGALALGAVADRVLRRLGGPSPGAARLGLLFVALGLFASAATLPRSYAIRQDFAGAVAFVDARRPAGAPVVTVGPASFAFAAYYAPAWLHAEDVAELRAIEARNDEVWVVESSRSAIKRRHPELLVRLEQEFEPQERLPGAIDGGDLVVHRSKYADVEIVTHDLGGGFYVLDTQRGSNVGLLVGEQGLLLIDPSHWALHRKLDRALRAISDAPPIWVFDSHWHLDHSGGNEPLVARGATVIATPWARERLDTALSEMHIRSEAALPTRLVEEDLTLHFAGQEIHAFHVPRAHTDGDLIVHFRSANLIHMGDLWVSGAFPYISAGSGGSIDGYIAAQRRVLALCDEKTRIIPGHGPVGTRVGLEASLRMLETARERVMQLKAAGRSLEETLAADPLQDMQAEWGGSWIRSAMMAETIYSTLPEG